MNGHAAVRRPDAAPGAAQITLSGIERVFHLGLSLAHRIIKRYREVY